MLYRRTSINCPILSPLEELFCLRQEGEGKEKEKKQAQRSTADAIDLQLDLASNRATSLQAPGASDVRGTRTVNLRKLGGAWQADPEEPLNPSNESSAASRR